MSLAAQLDEAASTVWHITSKRSADSIMRQGFVAQPTRMGRGVSVSTGKVSAKALLTAAQRLWAFKTEDAVVDWFVKMGAPRAAVEKLRANRSWPSPGRFYLSALGNLHPMVGGPADKIPNAEFLWSDIGQNLLKQGGPIVAVEAEYQGSSPKHVTGAIEAEKFVTSVRDLNPLRIVRSL
jgi:hypothetical protein